MVQNAGKALKNETNEETRQAQIATICLLFVPIFPRMGWPEEYLL